MSSERFLADIRGRLDEAGLRASLLVRDLATGRELSIDPERPLPAASLAKLPIALAVLNRVEDGLLDGAHPVTLAAGDPLDGTPGTARFRHPSTIALDDLVALALTISDNSAADALLGTLPTGAVSADLEAMRIDGIAVRHGFGELSDTPLERFAPDEANLALTLAIRGSTPADGHPVRQLDVARTNVGSARAWADLLTAIWLGRGVRPRVAARLREHLRGNVIRHRLAPDFSSDASMWSSKTGTLLNLRHEIGVVEHADGGRFVVVALSSSSVPATAQSAAEAALGATARDLHDRLRDDLPPVRA
ncbi:serine hydrolase [Curtobacterium sp. DN_7.5]|uniref:serine hydrolase n=1 Tax=Curtobacterium sp. DN_7.5 TaxID=3049047 RepID=UPI001F5928F5|nr:serine hydrolase [Curtobacterium sp. DN_7.5]